MKGKNHLIQYIMLVSILLIMILGSLVGCTSLFVKNSIKSTTQLPERVDDKVVEEDIEYVSNEYKDSEYPIEELSVPPPQPKLSYLQVMAVGDIMMHSPQLTAGYTNGRILYSLLLPFPNR